jgi:GNAT superfamily N-acetyltransferase
MAAERPKKRARPLRLREGRSGDWAFVRVLLMEAAGVTHPSFSRREIERHSESRHDRWARAGSYHLVAEHGGRPAGVVWVLPDSCVAGADYVQLVAVRAKYRRLGIARRLLAEAARRSALRGRLFLRAGIHRGNDPSVHLFSRTGFAMESLADGDLFFVRLRLAPPVAAPPA